MNFHFTHWLKWALWNKAKFSWLHSLKGDSPLLVQNSSAKVALGGCSLSYWIRAQVHVAFSPGREKARMRGHDSTLTFISPVAHCVAIRQRICRRLCHFDRRE